MLYACRAAALVVFDGAGAAYAGGAWEAKSGMGTWLALNGCSGTVFGLLKLVQLCGAEVVAGA